MGKVRFKEHESSLFLLRDLSQKCNRLGNQLEKEQLSPEVVELLRNTTAASDPVDRLAGAVRTLMGDKLLRGRYMTFLDSCLQLNSPHGLGRKRRVPLRTVTKGRSTGDVRSIVLSNTILDALAHRHICQDSEGKVQKPLSLSAFLRILCERHGFYLDQAPPGLSVSNEDLRRNRQTLERRLRDLGLLVGVNDAESMKRLHPRYHTTTGA